MIAGPNRMSASGTLEVSLAVVMKTYVWPMATAGIVALTTFPAMDPWTLTTLNPEAKVT